LLMIPHFGPERPLYRTHRFRISCGIKPISKYALMGWLMVLGEDSCRTGAKRKSCPMLVRFAFGCADIAHASHIAQAPCQYCCGVGITAAVAQLLLPAGLKTFSLPAAPAAPRDGSPAGGRQSSDRHKPPAAHLWWFAPPVGAHRSRRPHSLAR